jgi:hypothetical protein
MTKFKIISAHQPNFIPYLGFFDKMSKSDIFVIRDEVLYMKKEFHNRNKIRILSNKPQSKWISVPTDNPHNYILHTKIKNDCRIKNRPWHKFLLNEIKSNYANSPYFKDFFPKFEDILNNEDESLLKLNMKIINFLKDKFNINTKIILASELNLKPQNYQKSDASTDLAKICEALNASTYLSGPGAKTYLSLNPFKQKNINVEFQEFTHPVYNQSGAPFLPNMAAIDALFHTGIFPILKTFQLQKH